MAATVRNLRTELSLPNDIIEKLVSKYDQEIPLSQTNPWHR